MRSAFNPMGVIDMAKDYIIDYGYNSNGWWRKWKSGWIEQGGTITGKTVTINMYIPFSNVSYNVVFGYVDSASQSNLWIANLSAYNRTINSFVTQNSGSADVSKSWYACGY